MRRDRVVRAMSVVVAALAAMGAPAQGQEPAIAFFSTGDQVEGQAWLQDEAGAQYATWTAWGTPTGEALTLTLDLVTTEPGVPAQAWVTVGAIESGAPGPAIVGPSLVDLSVPGGSGVSVDPVVRATLTVSPADLPPATEGLWVLLERRGPGGIPVALPLGVQREALSVTGLGIAGPVMPMSSDSWGSTVHSVT
ncbi:MAG: hypothetical protein U0869_24305 [Chloroflexota bacterium]